jgi:hypothetical protein
MKQYALPKTVKYRLQKWGPTYYESYMRGPFCKGISNPPLLLQQFFKDKRPHLFEGANPAKIIITSCTRISDTLSFIYMFKWFNTAANT